MLMDVTPVEPLAAYIGGKRLLSKTIISKINQVPHKRYVEPFMGMSGIFLRRNKRAQKEVINDINKDIVNLFRVVQRHYKALEDMFDWAIASRDEFYRLRALPRELLTDIEQAYVFLYLQKQAFGGNPSFNGVVTYSNLRTQPLKKRLRMVHERLSSVFIDCLPYDELIRRQDKKETLFYLDPPYYGTETYYGSSFSKEDFDKLAGLLSNLNGTFILSINNVPEMRELFKSFYCETVNVKYSCNAKTTKLSEELIISNVKLE